MVGLKTSRKKVYIHVRDSVNDIHPNMGLPMTKLYAETAIHASDSRAPRSEIGMVSRNAANCRRTKRAFSKTSRSAGVSSCWVSSSPCPCVFVFVVKCD